MSRDGAPESFETAPDRYRHWDLRVEGRVARLALDVDEQGALLEGSILKLNSYDTGVDVELLDAVQRLRFEHPEVACVILSSGRSDIFCAGANIDTLARASHVLKVNFCKLGNETRLSIEDASRSSGQRYLAALAGTASGGGYELALACDRILMVDDGKSAVSLPEVPLLGVLPGTGGLTRLVDKRGVRRDLADLFCTKEEGVRAARALEWQLVDAIAPPSRFAELVEREAEALVAGAAPPPEGGGLRLEPLHPEVGDDRIEYEQVSVTLHAEQRTAEIRVRVPREAPADQLLLRALRLARELDDALLRLRFHHPQLGVWVLRTEGCAAVARALDGALGGEGWLAREVRALFARVLKRLDLSARSVFAVADRNSCFVGTLLELVLAADRSFLLDDPDAAVSIESSPLNHGAYPMANGLSRLETRFWGDPGALQRARETTGPLDAKAALELGLVTAAPDDIDFDDELRVAIEERASFSPDALTAMEASLRFPGPETLETKIFARLSAWQNWVFQRENATGPRGALKSYGQPERPAFDWRRT